MPDATEKRIIDLDEITTITSDMYVMVDNVTPGTRKYNFKTLTDNVESATSAANIAAGSARTAASVASDAAQTAASAVAAVETTTSDMESRVAQALASVDDVVAQAIPLMTPDVRGGALLGRGLEVEDGVLSVATEGDGAIRSVTAEGWATQDTTVGKNLLGISDNTMSGGGNVANLEVALAAGTYTLSFDCTTTGGMQVFVRDEGASSQRQVTISTGTLIVGRVKTTFTIDSAINWLRIYANAAGAYSNIQVESGSTATSYEPYTGGAPSPSPNYAQEIQVARGRNLWRYERGGYISSSGAYVAGTQSNAMSFPIPCVAGESYTYSSVAGSPQIAFYASDGTFVSPVVVGTAKLYTFTAPVTGYMYVWVNKSGTASELIADEYHPQLELGTAPTPYVPYGHVGLEVRGRNLANLANLFNGYISTDSVVASSSHRIVYMPCKPNTTYSVAKDIVAASDRFVIGESVGVPSNGVACTTLTVIQGTNIDANVGKRRSAIVTTSATARYLLVWAAGAGVSPNDVNLQVELGSTATSYVPYHHVTVPIPLPSKGFAASLPDGTCDTLTIDGAGHVEWESASEEYVVTGTEGASASATANGTGFYRTAVAVLSQKPSRATGATGYCTHAKFLVSTTEASYHCWTVGNYFVPVSDDDTGTAIWQRYAGARVIYPLATPTTEDCYVDLPITVEGDTVSIPELEDVAVVRWADTVATEVAQAWYRRAQAVESRVAALEAAVAEIVAG